MDSSAADSSKKFDVSKFGTLNSNLQNLVDEPMAQLANKQSLLKVLLKERDSKLKLAAELKKKEVELLHERGELQHRVKEMSERKAKLLEKLNATNADVVSVISSYAQIIANNETVETDTARLKHEMRMHKRDLQEITASFENLQLRTNTFKEIKQRDHEAQKAVDFELQRALTNLAAKKLEAEKLQRIYQSLKSNMASSDEAYSALMDEDTKLDDRKEKVLEKLRDSKLRCQEVCMDVEGMRSEREKILKETQAMENSDDTDVAAAENELADIVQAGDEEKGNEQMLLKKVDEEIELSSAEVAKLKEKHRGLLEKLGSSKLFLSGDMKPDCNIDELKAYRDSIRADIVSIGEKRSAQESEIRLMIDEIKGNERRLSEVDALVESERQRLDKAEQELAGTSLVPELTDKQRAIAEKRGRIAEETTLKRNEISASKHEIAELMAKITDARARLAKKQADNDELERCNKAADEKKRQVEEEERRVAEEKERQRRVNEEQERERRDKAVLEERRLAEEKRQLEKEERRVAEEEERQRCAVEAQQMREQKKAAAAEARKRQRDAKAEERRREAAEEKAAAAQRERDAKQERAARRQREKDLLAAVNSAGDDGSGDQDTMETDEPLSKMKSAVEANKGRRRRSAQRAKPKENTKTATPAKKTPAKRTPAKKGETLKQKGKKNKKLSAPNIDGMSSLSDDDDDPFAFPMRDSSNCSRGSSPPSAKRFRSPFASPRKLADSQRQRDVAPSRPLRESSSELFSEVGSPSKQPAMVCGTPKAKTGTVTIKAEPCVAKAGSDEVIDLASDDDDDSYATHGSNISFSVPASLAKVDQLKTAPKAVNPPSTPKAVRPLFSSRPPLLAMSPPGASPSFRRPNAVSTPSEITTNALETLFENGAGMKTPQNTERPSLAMPKMIQRGGLHAGKRGATAVVPPSAHAPSAPKHRAVEVTAARTSYAVSPSLTQTSALEPGRSTPRSKHPIAEDKRVRNSDLSRQSRIPVRATPSSKKRSDRAPSADLFDAEAFDGDDI